MKEQKLIIALERLFAEELWIAGGHGGERRRKVLARLGSFLSRNDPLAALKLIPPPTYCTSSKLRLAPRFTSEYLYLP